MTNLVEKSVRLNITIPDCSRTCNVDVIYLSSLKQGWNRPEVSLHKKDSCSKSISAHISAIIDKIKMLD